MNHILKTSKLKTRRVVVLGEEIDFGNLLSILKIAAVYPGYVKIGVIFNSEISSRNIRVIMLASRYFLVYLLKVG